MVEQLPLDHMLVSTNDVLQAQRTRLISLTEFCLLILFICELLLFLWLGKHQVWTKFQMPENLKVVHIIQFQESLVKLGQFFPL